MAYSFIGHMGYALIGLAVAGQTGSPAAIQWLTRNACLPRDLYGHEPGNIRLHSADEEG